MDRNIHLLVHRDDDESLWAEVPQYPGVFASGESMDELLEAVVEAITMVMFDGVGEASAEPVDEGSGKTFKVSIGGETAPNEDGQQILAERLKEESAEGDQPSAKVIDLRGRVQTPNYSVQGLDLLIEA